MASHYTRAFTMSVAIDIVRMSSGRPFHAVRPATQNARLASYRLSVVSLLADHPGCFGKEPTFVIHLTPTKR